MLVSRCSNILRTARYLKIAKNATPIFNQARSCHIVRYREAFAPARFYTISAEIWGGFFWWWVLWHIYHESEHLLGEWDVPIPEKWTDEELGIPPDYD